MRSRSPDKDGVAAKVEARASKHAEIEGACDDAFASVLSTPVQLPTSPDRERTVDQSMITPDAPYYG